MGGFFILEFIKTEKELKFCCFRDVDIPSPGT
jgi:hypothetical protein